MQTQNQKDAKMQQQLSSGKSFTQQHYLSKQKEAQVVRIESTDNSISMNLPALMPNFQQLGDMNGSSSSDLYYQLKSFRCRNIFENILPTDKIRLRSYISIRNAESAIVPAVAQTFVADGMADGLTIDINLCPNNEGYVTNANDLVKLLNDHILDYIWLHQDNETINERNVKNLFDYGYFQVVNSKCNFVYRYNANSGEAGSVRFYEYAGVPALNIVDDYWYIEYYNLTLEIPKEMSEQDQLRLARIFGCQQTLNGAYVTQYVVETVRTSQRIARVTNKVLRQNIDIVAADVDDGVYFSDNIAAPMYMYPLDSIYIRSNLQSNLWSKSGKKTNVIAVIPLNGTQDSLAVEYEPNSAANRTYNIKDSLNSMQHLQLQLTDKYGVPIVFLENYELEIAIFFMPPDPSVLFQ